MLAHGLRVYHRPSHLDNALELLRGGARPLAGGTRLLAAASSLPEVLDLSALPLGGTRLDDEDLVLGACLSLQDAIDDPLVWTETTGLLPAACRAASASRMLRGMATIGGESVHGAHDSEVVAALLALNAVFVVRRGAETLEIPGLRFLRNPAEDLGTDGLLVHCFLTGAPGGAALERVAVLPSAPSILSVAVAITFSGDHIARARIALTGLEGRPARILEAESRLEGSVGDKRFREQCLDQVEKRATLRGDAHASADYRRAVVRPLTARALDRAIAQARSDARPSPPRSWPVRRPAPPIADLIAWGGGALQMTVNGEARRVEALPRTTLLTALRGLGLFGVKHGCETGECGSCAVLLDGRPVNACLTLAARAHARTVTTVEALGTPDRLHPVQTAFVDTGAIQCGYCTPAMELMATALLEAIPDPTEAEVRDALAGCLCRCTGYVKPVEAVLAAARATKR